MSGAGNVTPRVRFIYITQDW